MSRNLSKNAIKRHNKAQNLKIELSLISLATSFLWQYEEDKSPTALSVQPLILDCYKITKGYLSKDNLIDILKVAENEFDLIEAMQKVTIPKGFTRVCNFDENNDLVVSAVALGIRLLEAHKGIQNKTFIVNSLSQFKDVNQAKTNEVENAKIVASKFFARINKYYNKRKI